MTGDVFRFAAPEWLWLLLLLLPLAFLKGRKGQRAAVAFPSADLVRKLGKGVKSRPGNPLLAIRLFTLALLVFALARPQFGEGKREIEASGIDIVLAVDLSGSMWAHDFEVENQLTDRLTVVKTVVEDFIKKRPADRIGIVVFAKDPYLVSPLTLNHEWLLQNLKRLEIGLIDESQTAIGSALGMSVNRLRAQKAKSRIVILLTDGEDNASLVTPEAAAEAATAYDIKVYTVGAGREGWVPMPQLDRRTGRPIRDRRGNMVMRRQPSSIDLETLKKIAEITSGQFYHATDTESLAQIYAEINRLEKSDVKMKFSTSYDEAFFWPALAGLVLLGLEQLLAHTRFRSLP